MALIEGNEGHCYDHYRFYASSIEPATLLRRLRLIRLVHIV